MKLRTVAAVALVAVVACGDGARPRPTAVLTITTAWPGASAEAVEQSVVLPLEQAVASVKGLGDITSRAEAGVATIVAEVERGQDARLAAMHVSRALQDARAQLPEEAMSPMVQTSRADDRPAITLAIEGNVSRAELGVMVRRDIARELERLVGVGRIELRGFVYPAIVIAPDLDRLAATRTTLLELARAITGANPTVPGGRVDASGGQLRILGGQGVADVDALRDLVVQQVGDVPVRLRDVASVVRDVTRVPASEAAKIAVHAQVGVLRMDVAGVVREQLPKLNLPLGVKVTEVPARSLPAPKQLAVSIVGMDLAELARLADTAIAEAKAAGVADVEIAPPVVASELVLEPDRDRAARYGISSADLFETIRYAMDEAHITDLRLDGEDMAVQMRISGVGLRTRLATIWLRGNDGALVPLGELVAASERMATPILRRNGQRAIELLAPKDAAAKLRSLVERAATKWPAGYRAVRPR